MDPAPTPTDAESPPVRSQDQFQLAVVVLVLLLALGWIGIYSTLGSGRGRSPRVGPEIADRLRSEHGAELRRLTEQQVQVYGYPVPEPAGS